jgi:hypothetical protein
MHGGAGPDLSCDSSQEPIMHEDPIIERPPTPTAAHDDAPCGCGQWRRVATIRSSVELLRWLEGRFGLAIDRDETAPLRLIGRYEANPQVAVYVEGAEQGPEPSVNLSIVGPAHAWRDVERAFATISVALFHASAQFTERPAHDVPVDYVAAGCPHASLSALAR